ncbi:FadR/GntR family transcriptional regulator [Actinomyces succiniciruminis]|uniref:GntR transcriptional regulator n=1 Tax=Actinomyces succiniciruminis TaxID=1522002 RepID=A0A1L7REF5_9ACTO|nr:FCD domain-containing protein [Actinomyces succiniciruminis]CED92431.1 GntR transcriptional regulator [Actinomyces succiniciruminis]
MSASALRGGVLDALGAAIVSGQVRPGEALTLESIQTRYGVSRTLARDCVRTLESAGLVESRRRTGAIVRPPQEWAALSPLVIHWQLAVSPDGPKLGALTELRAAIEPVAAAAAARRATEPQRTELLRLATTIRERGRTGEVASYLDADIAFHGLVLEASQNDTFAALTDVVAEVLTGRTRLDGGLQAPKPEALELHVQVAEAIAAGDSREAERCMREIVAEVRDVLLERGLRGFLTTT